MLDLVLAALLLLAPVLVNGRPSAFPDTAFYYSEGRYVAQLAGVATAWDQRDIRTDPTALQPLGAHQTLAGAQIGGARSPLYGVMVYASRGPGGLWALAAVQALLAAWVLRTALRAILGAARTRTLLGVTAALAVGSSLPFFVGLAMPDLFAGLAIAGFCVIAVYGEALSRAERWGLPAATALFAATHLSQALILIGLVVVASCLWRMRAGRLLAGRNLALAILITASGLALSGAAAWAVGHSLGAPNGQPPFITARLLADGPGRSYLRAACAARPAAYALCRYQGLPLNDADRILWETDPKRGVFTAADPATRTRLQQEQARFALGAAAYAPGPVLAAAGRNFLAQLALVRVEEPLRNPGDFLHHATLAATAIPSLIPDMAPCRVRPDACASRLSFGALAAWHQAIIILSLGFLAWRLSRPDVGGDPRAERFIGFVGLIGAGLLLNAALCGVLSGPYARYEARVIWLAPMCALLAALLFGPRPSRTPRNPPG